MYKSVVYSFLKEGSNPTSLTHYTIDLRSKKFHFPPNNVLSFEKERKKGKLHFTLIFNKLEFLWHKIEYVHVYIQTSETKLLELVCNVL